MDIGLRARGLIGAAAALAIGSGASASVRGFELFTPGSVGAGAGGYTLDNTGGAVHSVSARYDSASRRLDWSVNFSNRLTKGFWLVITGGAAPGGAPGRHAIFYFDATDALDATPTTNIRLSAYAYNGLDSATSWRDGDGNPSNDIPRGASIGDQGDLIKGIFDTGWIHSLTAANTVLAGGVNGRTLGFSVDIGDILAHQPRFGSDGSGEAAAAWTGAAFGSEIGIALHPVQSFNAIYDTVDNPLDPLDYGRIRTLSLGMQGALRANNMPTNDVPAPGGAVAAALIAARLCGRRRRGV